MTKEEEAKLLAALVDVQEKNPLAFMHLLIKCNAHDIARDSFAELMRQDCENRVRGQVPAGTSEEQIQKTSDYVYDQVVLMMKDKKKHS